MSNALYWTVLEYHGTRGIAKMHGMTVALKTPPVLDGYDVTAMRYIPEIGEAQLQAEPGQPWRRMTPEEIHDADALLRELTAFLPLDDPDELRAHTQRLPTL